MASNTPIVSYSFSEAEKLLNLCPKGLIYTALTSEYFWHTTFIPPIHNIAKIPVSGEVFLNREEPHLWKPNQMLCKKRRRKVGWRGHKPQYIIL